MIDMELIVEFLMQTLCWFTGSKQNWFMLSEKLKKSLGLTLIELLIALAIVATLAAIGVPLFSSYSEKNKISTAKTDIRVIQSEINRYLYTSDILPADLAKIGLGDMRDPYGNPYQYLVSNTGPPGKRRKDHNLVPVNTDYDLYSMGPDGQSVAPFTAQASRDDIVRANNGEYIGPVSDY